MHYRKYMITAAVVAALFIVAGCSDDEVTNPITENPQELITKVTITLIDDISAAESTAVWSDFDGPGGNDPVIGTLELLAGSTYSGSIELLDETKSPVEDISEEVEEEADEHQFFYTVEGDATSRMTVEITDLDSNNFPVGLEFTVSISSGGAAAGVLNVVLFHYDDVEKDGTSQSTESDIDIDIPVTIQ
ncbi:type 1 periplasmic binding fold superfamily protein [candidate division KSB1 bacterium]